MSSDIVSLVSWVGQATWNSGKDDLWISAYKVYLLYPLLVWA